MHRRPPGTTVSATRRAETPWGSETPHQTQNPCSTVLSLFLKERGFVTVLHVGKQSIYFTHSFAAENKRVSVENVCMSYQS